MTKKAHAGNRRLAKKRVQWLNEALCFVSSSVLAESSVLQNPLLRQAPKRYAILMTDEQIQLSKYVLEDLEILAEDFNRDEFQDKRIRNASAILNKLFNEGNLMKAWRYNVGNVRSPTLTAPRIEFFIEADVHKDLVHAVAGGAHLGGIYHALGILNKGSTALQIDPKINPIEYKYKLTEYFESSGLVLFSEPISRFTLIKYVANKAGGKHIDFLRSEKDEEKKFKKLDAGLEVFNIYEKNAVNVELHAIIQTICNSKDIQLLMEKIESIA